MAKKVKKTSTTAEDIILRMDKMENDRSNWDNRYQECGDYVMPQNSQITTKKADGQESDKDLFDTTGEESNQRDFTPCGYRCRRPQRPCRSSFYLTIQHSGSSIQDPAFRIQNSHPPSW